MLTAFFCIYVAMVLLPVMPRAEVAESVDIARFRGGDGQAQAVLLDDGDRAFAAKIAVIERAQERIAVATFAISDDDVSRIFFGALFDALRRGVTVSVLVDGMGQPDGSLSFAVDALLCAGGTYSVYAPLDLWAPTTLNDRMHDKYMTVDGVSTVLGGRNIGARYYDTTAANAAHDCDVLVTGGTAATQVEDYFYKVLRTRQVKQVQKNFSARRAETLFSQADACIEAYRAYSAEARPQAVFDDCIDVGRVTLVTNGLEYGAKRPVIFDTVLSLLESGEDCIVQTPYTALTGARRKRLCTAAANGNVTWLTNSLASSPNLPAFSRYLYDRKRYVRSGLDVYEYQSNTISVHAKTAVVGNDLTVVGSFNMDERSVRIDTESILIIEGEAFNRHTRGVLEGYRTASARVGTDGRYTEGAAPAPVRTGKTTLFYAAGAVLWIVGYLV